MKPRDTEALLHQTDDGTKRPQHDFSFTSDEFDCQTLRQHTHNQIQ